MKYDLAKIDKCLIGFYSVSHKNYFDINDEVSKLRRKNAKLHQVVICLWYQLEENEKHVILQVSKIDELENDISDQILQFALKNAELQADLNKMKISVQNKQEK